MAGGAKPPRNVAATISENRAVANKSTSTVFYKGKMMQHYQDVKIKDLEEIQSIFSVWTQKDADIWTTPELRKKYVRLACAE